ncbi:MAG: hypothetical protein A2Z29_00780 [Chloroflexi bacterium RBG_16_56_11]|nr:MAG: hypothetical protein A2Z29_00780 [Chloroflexi bacterium RBG_16_56_11]
MNTEVFVAQVIAKEEPQWANPGALGLAGFGLNTILLQIHNIGWMDSTMPLIFGLTAFTSYGLFWLGLSFSFLLQWTGVVKLDNSGLAWLFVMWGVFTGYMAIGTLKMTYMHLFVFVTLTVLFFLLAAHFFGAVSAMVPGIEGIFCGAGAVYGSAAVIVNAKYGREYSPWEKSRNSAARDNPSCGQKTKHRTHYRTRRVRCYLLR